MQRRIPPGLVILLVALACSLAVFAVARMRSHGRSLEDWAARLPHEGAILLYLDVEGLRRMGVLEWLALSRLGEEPEYRAFVEQTGFDARQDLRQALVGFHPEGNFFLLRGRFDWEALRRFVERNGGSCYNSFCRVAGSLPERRISYFPLRPDVMALAVSRDSSAAERLQLRGRGVQFAWIPQAPVWAAIPSRRLASARELPAGTRLFAEALAETERLVFALYPAGDRLELRLEVSCSSAEQAGAVLRQLRGLTEALRELIARENKRPNPRDLSGVLTAGVFEQRGNRVLGTWPLGRPFLESLAAGSM
ncbi:MAG: hypothetical protein RMI94_11815 [Bryobacterales bacterium]|nr:hypothetical protein [Bryobacteraceae bacterium]MDW8131230.1 hypothetical protein [Bryobacterales bacterium]